MIVIETRDGSVAGSSPRLDTVPDRIQLSEDGRRVLTFGAGAPPRVRDAGTGGLLLSIDSARDRARLDATGRHLLAWRGGDAPEVWDVDRRRRIASLDVIMPAKETIQEGGDAGAAVFAGDGQRVAITAGTSADTLRAAVFDVQSGRRLFALRGGWSSFDRSGALMAATTPSGLVEIWRVVDGTRVMSFADPWGMDAALHPDGGLLVTINGDGQAVLRNARDGSPLAYYPVPPMFEAPDPGAAPDGMVIELTTTVCPPSFDGDSLVTRGRGVTAWPIALEERSPAEIARIATARDPWRLVDGRLVLATRAVRGTLTHAGRPVPGALVVLERASDDPLGHRATTDDTGEFELGEVLPGSYWIRSQSDPARPLEVRDGDNTPIELELRPPASSGPGTRSGP